MARLADPEMVSDVGTGALLARAGAHAAAFNVRINLRHISDDRFNEDMRSRLRVVREECDELADATVASVDRVLEGEGKGG